MNHENLDESIELVKKYFGLMMEEYMSYITYDEKLEPESKAIRKATVQSLRKLLSTMEFLDKGGL